jgi:hypothetical protein
MGVNHSSQLQKYNKVGRGMVIVNPPSKEEKLDYTVSYGAMYLFSLLLIILADVCYQKRQCFRNLIKTVVILLRSTEPTELQ